MGSWLLWNFTPGLPAFGGPVTFVSACVLGVGTVCAAACEAEFSSGSPLLSLLCDLSKLLHPLSFLSFKRVLSTSLSSCKVSKYI